jgi:adenylate/nucleoside-diphosphate kinase
MTTLKIKRGRTNFISPKLVAALDRCKLSVRDSVYIIQATAEALGNNTDNLVINKSSIHRCRDALRVEHANKIKTKFQSSIPNYITIHWDGKILPTLNVRDSGIDRLPIVLTSKKQDLVIGIPKMEKSTGKEQANAIYYELENWGVTDVVQALCCDTTGLNIERFIGEKIGKRFTLPTYVFETVLPHTTTSPDIPLFKNFRNNWNKIDITNTTSGIDDLECCICVRRYTK